MKNKFLQGTLILLITSLLLRGMGFVYQMLIVRFAGTEAVGLLNMSFPFYIIFVVLATSGMPVAIAKLTAGYVSQGREYQITTIMRTAFLLVAVLSLCGFAVAFFIMPEIFLLLGTEKRVAQCFLVLIPGIIIVPFCSVMRGYFQGMQQMIFPSAGQIAEQLIRVASGLFLIIWVCPRDVLSLAMALAMAAMLGELAGCLLLLFFYLYARHRQKQSETERTFPSRTVLPELLSLGLPTTFTRLTSSIDMAIEASLVPFCLIAAGYNTSQAASIYGQFSGVAVSLITIPTVLTGALGTALIPAVAEADAAGNRTALEQRCSQSVLITWMCSLPVILLIYVYGEELCLLLFHIEGLGSMMRMLSFGAVFMYLEQTLVGILQGLGRTRTVFLNNFAGSASKLIGMYYCIRILDWGSIGIAGGMVLGYGLQCLLNLTALSRIVKIHLEWNAILLPVLFSFIMLILIEQIVLMFPAHSILLLLAMVCGGLFYLLALWCSGQLSVLTGRTGIYEKNL